MTNPGGFQRSFRISNRATAALTRIERARGFLDAAKLSEDWLGRTHGASCEVCFESQRVMTYRDSIATNSRHDLRHRWDMALGDDVVV
jgi:hypothetical protein